MIRSFGKGFAQPLVVTVANLGEANLSHRFQRKTLRCEYTEKAHSLFFFLPPSIVSLSRSLSFPSLFPFPINSVRLFALSLILFLFSYYVPCSLTYSSSPTERQRSPPTLLLDSLAYLQIAQRRPLAPYSSLRQLARPPTVCVQNA